MGGKGRCTETGKEGERLLKSWNQYPKFVKQREGREKVSLEMIMKEIS